MPGLTSGWLLIVLLGGDGLLVFADLFGFVGLIASCLFC